MGYGGTLCQRSIPEWRHFNIDYDYLKDLIKQQTTPGTSKPVLIPEKAFGVTFYKALKAQHDRIGLFIRSKSGEIERRLEHIRSLEQLQARQAPEGPGGRFPARVVERYAKIDADVTKAGEEIRSLSRFQVAQRTGFHKILNKYKRWTKDADLEVQFRDAVTNSPDSFYQLDMGYLLDQYIDVLGALRAPFDAPGASPTPGGVKASSPASWISQTAQDGTEVDFDLTLSITPLGSRGSKATYWIHQDHIVELQVLILQQMRLYSGPNTTTTQTPKDSPEATPKRRMSSATMDKNFGDEDSVGLLVLDHPESFAIRQNASTIASSEETTGTQQTKAAGIARWTYSGDSAVVVGLGQPSEDVPTAKLKRKHLAAFLDTSVTFKNRNDSELQNQENRDGDQDPKTGITATHQWLTAHKEVKPIGGICSKRSRFVGLHNNSAGGMWATIDRDVFMKDSLYKDLNDKDWLSKARTGSTGFPHAVLEIRREGSYSSALIQTLDSSHIVERVRGFSLEAHAVWVCCKLSAMSTPFWIPLLDKDIRTLPPPVRRQRRKATSTTGSLFRDSPPQTSTSATSRTNSQPSPITPRIGEYSATSAPELEQPSLKAFRKKRKPYSEYPPSMHAESERRRYWNEYDNPESEDEGYYIYVDPSASDTFPGHEFFEALAAKAKKLFGIREAPEEVLGLSIAESSDSETADESPVAALKPYGTFASKARAPQHEDSLSGLFRTLRDPHREAGGLHTVGRETECRRRTFSEIQIRQHKTELTKRNLYFACIVMAVVLDVTLGMMTTTSRKKERGVVDTVVLFGTICNLLLCFIAVISMTTRRERLGWFHWGVVLLVVIGNTVMDVMLLGWVFDGL